MSTCVFSGTFDPITKGHEDIILRCKRQYKKVIIVLGFNPDKECLFSEEQRYNFLTATFPDLEVVKYSEIKDTFKEFLKERNVKYYVRGIRNEIDFEYEEKYKKQNAKLYPDVQTVYVPSGEWLENISSSKVRELILEGKDYSEYVPNAVLPLIKKEIAKAKLEKK